MCTNYRVKREETQKWEKKVNCGGSFNTSFVASNSVQLAVIVSPLLKGLPLSRVFCFPLGRNTKTWSQP